MGTLSNLLVAGALVGSPLLAAADPHPTPVASTTDAKVASPTDEARYAQLEKESPAAANFEGGGNGVYIGGSALTVVLIILLIVIVL